MQRPDMELLVEQAVSVWRPRSPDGTILPHSAWADLTEAGRALVFDETLRWRALEQAIDGETLSATCRTILSRIARSG